MLHDDKASINKKVGLRIKEARKSRGLTLAELGNKIGLSESNTQRYESGRISSVSVELINKIAKALNVSPAFLMGWEDDITTNSPSGYYTDPEAAEYAEELRTNPNLRIMFSAAKDITKEQMQKTVEYIEFLKSKEKGNSDEY